MVQMRVPAECRHPMNASEESSEWLLTTTPHRKNRFWSFKGVRMQKFVKIMIVAALAGALMSCSVSTPSVPNPFGGAVSPSANNKVSQTGMDPSVKLENLPSGTTIRLVKPLVIPGKGEYFSNNDLVLLRKGEARPISEIKADNQYCLLAPTDMTKGAIESMLLGGGSITLKAGSGFSVAEVKKDDVGYTLIFQSGEFAGLAPKITPLTANEFLNLCFGDKAVFEAPVK